MKEKQGEIYETKKRDIINDILEDRNIEERKNVRGSERKGESRVRKDKEIKKKTD
jgi:hypothetical protein